MPIEVEWHIPYRVIDETMSGKLSSHDMDEHTSRMLAMLQEAEIHAPGKLVYLLLDTTRADIMPPAYLMLQHALPVLRMKNRGLMILITQSKTFRSIIELTAHVMRFPVHSVATREEALKVLAATMYKDEARPAG